MGISYTCGPLKGKIELNRIREITKGKNSVGRFKTGHIEKGFNRKI